MVQFYIVAPKYIPYSPQPRISDSPGGDVQHSDTSYHIIYGFKPLGRSSQEWTGRMHQPRSKVLWGSASGWWFKPLWKIWVRQLGLFSIDGKIKVHVPVTTNQASIDSPFIFGWETSLPLVTHCTSGRAWNIHDTHRSTAAVRGCWKDRLETSESKFT